MGVFNGEGYLGGSLGESFAEAPPDVTDGAGGRRSQPRTLRRGPQVVVAPRLSGWTSWVSFTRTGVTA